ncbi:hypothetical protein ACFO0S_01475 [Chryseomicrobium palamuruense]|uniref:N-acetyltransferase domain-containing protein n=1 Tax=Chryseomicrobium palamuruense TaxID=682973 RepID=A0ABV8UTC0_9BACL
MRTIQVGPYPLQVRLLSHDDFQGILQLQEKVYRSLAQPEHLQQLTEEEIDVILTQQLFAGAFNEEKLVAARAFLRPVNDPEHLAKDVGIPEDEWEHVIYSEITVVDPDFQGYGLQKKLGEWWLERLVESDVSYICTTVAPFNIASMKDKFHLGMKIAALKHKYNGKLRYVFVKNLHRSSQCLEETRKVPMIETAKQQQLLAEGFLGTAIKEEQGVWWVHYTLVE